MRRTAKLTAAVARLRALKVSRQGLADHDAIYAELSRRGFAWDPDAGWYTVDEPAGRSVAVRLIGTHKDLTVVLDQLRKLGASPASPRPADGGLWRLYTTIPTRRPR